ncbi:hypothetical protein NM688_g2770 [Phlebia brevispora]|uniref:Uncharacterized protein n=1 Tax=Phlebia brevispora TaxID=194682 RepID=A0ACC1T7R7_9APHY|nr:hypothetical protein NM688_g2770 [Phlebia brevispora]
MSSKVLKIGTLPKYSTYDIVTAYVELTRLHRWPLGSNFAFWPRVYGLLMGSLGTCQQISFHRLCTETMLYVVIATILHCMVCIHNDICDREVDGQVKRTKQRPLVSGRASVGGAWTFFITLALAALYVQTYISYKIIPLSAVNTMTLTARYPFMKRYSWWPQLTLGLAGNWGLLTAWLAATSFTAHMPPLYAMYAGLICWTIYFDTIYACQDRIGDAKIGLKSTALLFGSRVKPILSAFAGAYIAFIVLAGVLNGNGAWFFASCGGAAVHLLWQQYNWNPDDPEDCAVKFKVLIYPMAIWALSSGLVCSWIISREAAADPPSLLDNTPIVHKTNQLWHERFCLRASIKRRTRMTSHDICELVHLQITSPRVEYATYSLRKIAL